MEGYKKDGTMNQIKRLLNKKSKKFLVDEVLKAYWHNTDLLNKSEVFKEWLEIQRKEF